MSIPIFQFILFPPTLDFFFFFGSGCVAYRISVPQPGIKPVPLWWKCGVLTTGSPRKF